jgi:hypothetical protein
MRSLPDARRVSARATRWLPALMLALLAQIAAADEAPNLLDNSFAVTLGTFLVDTDTEVRLDGTVIETGTPVDLENTFGGEDANVFRLDAGWRFADRHKVRAFWFKYDRSETRTIDEVIEWGDATFPVSASVTADTEFSIVELAYEYSFLKRETLELAGSFGVHTASYEGQLSAMLPDGTGGSVRVSDKADFSAPLPVLGFHALWRMSGNFWLEATVQYFSLSYEEYDGSILDTRAAVLWQPRPWAGVGVGFNRFKVNFSMDGARFHGEFDWIYQGPQIFYSVSF